MNLVITNLDRFKKQATDFVESSKTQLKLSKDQIKNIKMKLVKRISVPPISQEFTRELEEELSSTFDEILEDLWPATHCNTINAKVENKTIHEIFFVPILETIANSVVRSQHRYSVKVQVVFNDLPKFLSEWEVIWNPIDDSVKRTILRNIKSTSKEINSKITKNIETFWNRRYKQLKDVDETPRYKARLGKISEYKTQFVDQILQGVITEIESTIDMIKDEFKDLVATIVASLKVSNPDLEEMIKTLQNISQVSSYEDVTVAQLEEQIKAEVQTLKFVTNLIGYFCVALL